MEKPFLFPLTMKNGKVFDSTGKDITEAYQQFKQVEAAEKLTHALEILGRVKLEGQETRRLLFVDTVYKYAAVVETFIGDDLSERLNLAYAGKVKLDDENEWSLTKLNRMLLPINSLPDLYKYVSNGYLTIQMAEQAWDHRNCSFYMIKLDHTW
ncbi:hypothetical protein [Effusibacillus dendaii]|uniref:Uncharacterized protein n=1 Tax=Effusibacillus dendaii TaxID=2743772 RepID=A0A7I8DBE8_9BACL|nr:hypothetical protein [Effusibacillus dendaii]BCJ86166.1 hypothetical protein skT53_11510 [Effusibacillus dendaii]